MIVTESNNFLIIIGSSGGGGVFVIFVIFGFYHYSKNKFSNSNLSDLVYCDSASHRRAIGDEGRRLPRHTSGSGLWVYKERLYLASAC